MPRRDRTQLGGLGGLGGPSSGPSLRVTIGKNKGDPVVMGLLKSSMFPLQQVLEGEGHRIGDERRGVLFSFHPVPDE